MSRDSERQRLSSSKVRSDDDSDFEVDSAPGNDDSVTPVSFSFTAIQIINRFLEVFAMPQSTKRILAIGELFAADAKMCSLKNPLKVYLDGAEKIANSFLLAEPSNATLSKRIFFDASPAGAVVLGSGDTAMHSPITFCIDFHRAGCSPGLGDVTKPTVLLYRCDAQHITAVWGMVDKDNIADSTEDLSLEKVKCLNTWALCLNHVLIDMPEVVSDEETHLASSASKDAKRVHFHNYDKIDVWG